MYFCVKSFALHIHSIKIVYKTNLIPTDIVLLTYIYSPRKIWTQGSAFFLSYAHVHMCISLIDVINENRKEKHVLGCACFLFQTIRDVTSPLKYSLSAELNPLNMIWITILLWQRHHVMGFKTQEYFLRLPKDYLTFIQRFKLLCAINVWKNDGGGGVGYKPVHGCLLTIEFS